MATGDANEHCTKANTKRSGSRHSRVPNAKYGFVRRSTPADKLPLSGGHSELLFDDGMGSLTRNNVNVEFSLNKKGRFRLLDVVRGNGIVELNELDESEKVEAIERVARPDARRRSRAAVIGYHTVDDCSHEIHRKPTKTFSFDLNPAAVKPPKKQKKKKVATYRRLDVQRDDDGSTATQQIDDAEKRVTYEFIHANRRATLIPKRRYCASPIRPLDRRHHPKFVEQDFLDYESIDDIDAANREEAERASYARSIYVEPEPREIRANLIDFLLPNISRIERRRKKSSHTRASMSSSSWSTDSFETFDTDEIDGFDEPTTSAQATTILYEPQLRYFEMPAVEATILTQSLESESLQANYGDKYYECACIPRRICINISTAVRNVMLISHGVDFVHSVDQLQVFCVIEVEPLINLIDEDDELLSLDGHSLSFCRLWLNGNFESQTPLELRMIDVLEDYSIDEILSATAKMVGTMPREYFKLNPKAQRTYAQLTPSRMPEKSLISCSAYTDIHHATGSMEMEKAATTALVEMKQTQRVQRQITAVKNFMEWRSMSVSMRVCDICCTEDEDTWALAACHHWFCKQCWLDYLCTQIRKGAHLILCPEFDCKSVLNYDLLCTVVPLPLCRTYASVVRDQYIQSHHNEMTWCENLKCNRVICFRKPSARDDVVLTCDACGFTWCSSCRREPHWPATCEQSELYIGKLRLRGDDKPGHVDRDKIMTVRVKQCPHCHRRMEKGEGCNHMACRCGRAFCWACLGDWSAIHYQCKVNNQHNFEKVRLIDVDPKGKVMVEPWYMKCVSHHQRLFSSSLKTTEQLFHRGLIRIRKMGKEMLPRRGSTDNVFNAMNVLLQAYTQAHYILEFTFVYIYFAQDIEKRHRCRIDDLAQRLAFVVSRLEESCVDGDGERMRRFIPVVHELFQKLVASINAAKH